MTGESNQGSSNFAKDEQTREVGPPLEPPSPGLATTSVAPPSASDPGPATRRPKPEGPQPLVEFLKEDQEAPWLVDGWVPPGSVGLIVGPPGAGKSWLGNHLALSLAQGLSFVGRYRVRTARRVLLVDNDSAPRTVKQRLRAFARNSLPSGDALQVWTGARHAFDTPDGLRELLDHVQKSKPALVIIEMLGTCVSPGFDENSAKDANRFFGNLKKLVEETGCTVLVSHHLRKNRSDGNMLTQVRGSSALTGSVDFGISICAIPTRNGSKRFAVRALDKRVTTTAPFEFELTAESKDEHLVKAEVRWIQDLEDIFDLRVARQRAMIMAWVRGAGKEGQTVSGLRLVAAGYISEQRLRELLDDLVDDGKLVHAAKAQNQYFFWIPEFAPGGSLP